MRFLTVFVATLALAVLARPAVAGSFDLTASPSEAGPGDVVTVQISGAPANSHVVLFVALDDTPTTFGPFDTRCGILELSLDLNPRGPMLRLRTDQDGNASFELAIPARLPSRFDGTTFFVQSASVAFSIDPGPPPTCAFDVCTSNLGSVTLVIP